MTHTIIGALILGLGLAIIGIESDTGLVKLLGASIIILGWEISKRGLKDSKSV